MIKYKPDKFIIVLLVAVTFLRMPLLFEGLPAVFNSTEYFLAKIALSMGARFSLDPLIYIYPTFYSYILLVIFSLLFVTGYVFSFFNGAHDYGVQFLTDPTAFYFAGRMGSLIFSLLTIYFLYSYIKKYRNTEQGQIAALLAGFSLSFFEFSGYATPESFLILISTFATLYILKTQNQPDRKNYFIAGILSGLAVGVKYNAGFIFLGILIVYVFNFKRDKQSIWLALSGAVTGFIVINPYWVLNFTDFYHGYLLISDQMYSAISTDRGVNYLWELSALFKSELCFGLLFITSTIWSFKSSFKKYLPFLIIIIVTFLYVGSWTKKGLDYLFPIFPAWIYLSSEFIVQMFNRYNLNRNYKRTIYLFIFGPSLILICYNIILILNDDTREKTTDWIIANVSNEESICYDNHHYDIGVFDIDRFISYGAGAKDLPEQVKMKLEQYRDDQRNIHMVPIMFETPAQPDSGINLYEAEQERFKRKNLSQIIAEGVDYLIIRDDYYEMYRQAKSGQYSPVIIAKIEAVNTFYERLFTRYQPSIEYVPDVWTKGPRISIYKISGE